MQSTIHTVLTLALWLCAARSLAGPIDRLPSVPAPPQAQVEWIAQDMRMNGLAMSLRAFRCPTSTEETLRFYESWWASQGSGREAHSFRSHTRDWEVLALTSAAHHISIQVRSTNTGTEGTIAVSPNPKRAKLKLDTQFPLTDALKIENLQQYEDEGTRAEHITAKSRRSVSMEEVALQERLKRNGWTILRSHRASLDSHILQGQKGRELAHIELQAMEHSTNVVIIWRKG